MHYTLFANILQTFFSRDSESAHVQQTIAILLSAFVLLFVFDRIVERANYPAPAAANQ